MWANIQVDRGRAPRQLSPIAGQVQRTPATWKRPRIAALGLIATERGSPSWLSLDEHSEVRSRAVDAWATDRGGKLVFIQPGRSMQNAHIKSFNVKSRIECRNPNWFMSPVDTRLRVEQDQRGFGGEGPHAACHPSTPDRFARTSSISATATIRLPV